jgi:hypothetical protein
MHHLIWPRLLSHPLHVPIADPQLVCLLEVATVVKGRKRGGADACPHIQGVLNLVTIELRLVNVLICGLPRQGDVVLHGLLPEGLDVASENEVRPCHGAHLVLFVLHFQLPPARQHRAVPLSPGFLNFVPERHVLHLSDD